MIAGKRTALTMIIPVILISLVAVNCAAYEPWFVIATESASIHVVYPAPANRTVYLVPYGKWCVWCRSELTLEFDNGTRIKLAAGDGTCFTVSKDVRYAEARFPGPNGKTVALTLKVSGSPRELEQRIEAPPTETVPSSDVNAIATFAYLLGASAVLGALIGSGVATALKEEREGHAYVV